MNPAAPVLSTGNGHQTGRKIHVAIHCRSLKNSENVNMSSAASRKSMRYWKIFLGSESDHRANDLGKLVPSSNQNFLKGFVILNLVPHLAGSRWQDTSDQNCDWII